MGVPTSVEIEDTFAEAFPAYFTRVLITAASEKWALTAAEATVGFGTSIIMCPSEAGIERLVPPNKTPDGRPGVIIQIWHPDKEKLEAQVLRRVSQCTMPCPTTSVYNALAGQEEIAIGAKIRTFGDGFEQKWKMGDRKVWRVPVMEGEFLIEHSVGVGQGVSGGNLILLGTTQESALKAAEVAANKIKTVEGVILTFPGGVCRSGSKVWANTYKTLVASTNQRYCPTIREKVPDTALPPGVQSVYELVFSGIDLAHVQKAMGVGIKAAIEVEGIKKITAGNYGGKLGPYKLYLKEALKTAGS
jgi:formylmethanofuran--tetrahydromethanopterin N-formyltransferase